jgi:archaellum component FlaC
MANSKAIMARLTRVEQDSADFKKMLGQVANILTDQSDRIDRLGEQLGDRMDRLSQQLGSRLDRLIAVTIQERTYSFERLADIERRLARLEEHAGI